MEEDIKVLEELCNSFKYQQSKLDELERDDYAELIQDIEIIAIENLIKGHKELEEEKKRQSIAIIEYQDLLENSIPKSKVREKIEFYKRYGKIKNSNEYVMSVEIFILEELLQDKE